MPTIIAYPDGSNWDFKYVDDGRPAGGAENYTFVPYDQATPEQKALLNPKLDTTNSGKFRPSPLDPSPYSGSQGSGGGKTASKPAKKNIPYGPPPPPADNARFFDRNQVDRLLGVSTPRPGAASPAMSSGGGGNAFFDRSQVDSMLAQRPQTGGNASAPLLSNLPTDTGMGAAPTSSWENTWDRQQSPSSAYDFSGVNGVMDSIQSGPAAVPGKMYGDLVPNGGAGLPSGGLVHFGGKVWIYNPHTGQMMPIADDVSGR